MRYRDAANEAKGPLMTIFHGRCKDNIVWRRLNDVVSLATGFEMLLTHARARHRRLRREEKMRKKEEKRLESKTKRWQGKIRDRQMIVDRKAGLGFAISSEAISMKIINKH